jgi:CDGSH-type Zn-finger protein
MEKNQKVSIMKDGPYVVSGNIPLSKDLSVTEESGVPEKRKKGKKYPQQESYALCRCGESKNKPFCDGSHITCRFQGTETASRKKYLQQANKISGPKVDLTDVQEFCAVARFCDLANGTWESVENSDDPECKKIAIQTACNCPSGRLVVWDKKTGKPIEPELEPSIGIIEDIEANVSGPLWVK